MQVGVIHSAVDFVSAIPVEKDVDVIAIRLKPGEDLKPSLLRYCIDQKIDAAYMLSCVGSLRKAAIRFANQPEGTVFKQPLEIVSLEGTLSQHGAHLHIVVSDSEGQVIGGHLMDGSNIYTTAEIVLGIVPDAIFKREIDPLTGYIELTITS
ncbi:DNA-binding protein [Leptothoe sp. LEGE 181152]|nr:DNA-binding protein [Leptothoe sp. LEGE 181152]